MDTAKTVKASVFLTIPTQLKADVKEILPSTQFRSVTHLIETCLREFVQKHKNEASRNKTKI